MEFLPSLGSSKCVTTEFIRYRMPLYISMLKHPLWQMAEDWKGQTWDIKCQASKHLEGFFLKGEGIDVKNKLSFKIK